jgi:acyl phosphate:glycerol-3-phosphate acyltransferase
VFSIESLIAILLGYLLGSIPFGIVLTRLFGAGDLRQIGSGSIGATNVLRTGRKGLAAATVLLDGGKGAVAVLMGEAIAPGLGLIGGAAALVGHCYPVWLRFNGGKGVATMLGISLALSWIIALVFAAIWLTTFAVFRISSVSGMMAAVSTSIAALVLGNQHVAVILGILAVIVLWKHRSNIQRLIAGTEPRVGQKV